MNIRDPEHTHGDINGSSFSASQWHILQISLVDEVDETDDTDRTTFSGVFETDS